MYRYGQSGELESMGGEERQIQVRRSGNVHGRRRGVRDTDVDAVDFKLGCHGNNRSRRDSTYSC